MKRFVLIIAVAMLASSCQVAQYYITYDTVQLHKEPSADSPVVVNITCSPKPGYDEFNRKSRLLYWNGPRKNPIPLALTKTDKSGEWGYLNIYSTGARENFRGWLPLNQMLFCGTGSANEKMEACTARQNKVMLYKHPKAVAGEQTKFWLSKGDTVQVSARENGWAHVHKVTTYTAIDDVKLYGWVQEKQLEPMESFSVNSQKAQKRADTSEGGIRDGLKLEQWRIILAIGAALALLVAILYAGKAKKRGRFGADIVFKVGLSAVLAAGAVWGTYKLSVDFMDVVLVLVVPMLIYSFMYPLLYINSVNQKWSPLFLVVAGTATILVFLPSIRNFRGYGTAMVYFGMAATAAAFALWRIWRTYKKVPRYICPQCGCYGDHEEGPDVLDKVTRGKPRRVTRSQSRHVGDVVTYRGDKEVSREGKYVTEYYTEIVVTVTKYFHRDRTCIVCGHMWQEKWTTNEEESATAEEKSRM